MRPLEFTYIDSVTERMTSAGGVKGQWPRCGSTSSTTAAGEETSRARSGKRWERPRAGKQADADTCRSQSCFPWKSVIMRL